MDKNTITGLILMGLVMFGFMYLSKPDEAQLAAEREQQEQVAKANAQAEAEAARSTVFNAADSAALAGAVRSTGTPDANGAIVFSNDNLNLTLDSEAGLGGTFTDGGESFDICDILANRAALTTARATRAARAIRSVIDNAARYEGFARYLGGENREVVLENELIRLTLNTRGGRIASAELKTTPPKWAATPPNNS